MLHELRYNRPFVDLQQRVLGVEQDAVGREDLAFGQLEQIAGLDLTGSGVDPLPQLTVVVVDAAELVVVLPLVAPAVGERVAQHLHCDCSHQQHQHRGFVGAVLDVLLEEQSLGEQLQQQHCGPGVDIEFSAEVAEEKSSEE